MSRRLRTADERPAVRPRTVGPILVARCLQLLASTSELARHTTPGQSTRPTAVPSGYLPPTLTHPVWFHRHRPIGPHYRPRPTLLAPWQTQHLPSDIRDLLRPEDTIEMTVTSQSYTAQYSVLGFLPTHPLDATGTELYGQFRMEGMEPHEARTAALACGGRKRNDARVPLPPLLVLGAAVPLLSGRGASQ